MKNILVTGANRGIGLELCRQLRARGEQVIAVCRNSSAELDALGARVVEDVDVASDQSVARLAAQLRGVQLDWLINNAGILSNQSLDSLDFEAMEKQYRVNALGPLRVTAALQANLGAGSKVGIITSRMGSIDDNTSGGSYGYRMSKAAVNMAGVSLARDLRDRSIAVALLHPGYVMTDMTGGKGLISTTESARGLIQRMDDLDTASSGGFWHVQGEVLPW
jgi:NAD(P)-dependent dehydrogenase (short-subunit alcohol dehydrogenase family)